MTTKTLSSIQMRTAKPHDHVPENFSSVSREGCSVRNPQTVRVMWAVLQQGQSKVKLGRSAVSGLICGSRCRLRGGPAALHPPHQHHLLRRLLLPVPEAQQVAISALLTGWVSEQPVSQLLPALSCKLPGCISKQQARGEHRVVGLLICVGVLGGAQALLGRKLSSICLGLLIVACSASLLKCAARCIALTSSCQPDSKCGRAQCGCSASQDACTAVEAI